MSEHLAGPGPRASSLGFSNLLGMPRLLGYPNPFDGRPLSELRPSGASGPNEDLPVGRILPKGRSLREPGPNCRND